MNDQVRINSELLKENTFLKQKIQELEHSESVRTRAEEALRQSEEKYRTLIENIQDGIYILDSFGNFTFVNDVIVKRSGFPAEWFLGRSYIDVIIEEDRERVQRYFNAGMDGKTQLYDLSYPHKSGNLLNVEVSTAPLFDGAKVIALLGISRDISERRRLEKALVKSEEKLRLITGNMVDCVALVDASGTYQYVTPSYREVLGYGPEDMVGISGFNLFHPDDLERVLKLYMDGIEQGLREIRYEIRFRHRNGHYVPMEVRARSLKDTQGKIMGGILAARDITERLQIDEERKQAEKELRKSEEKYRTIIESMEDGYHEVDLKGNFTLFNESTRKMMGYEREDLLGMNYRQYADEENIRKIYQVYNQVYQTGEPVKNFEWQIIRKDGDRRDIEVSISLIRNTEGHPTGFRGIVRDTTDRKRGEEEKAKLEEQYRQAQKMEAIGQLAGGVAHDFNNMLSIILGYSQVALMKIEPSDPLNANFQEIMNAAQRSADLVRQLLAFARKQTIAPKALDLNDTVAGMLNMLRKLIGEDINLLWIPAANLWPVKMDPVQVDQILANLAVNARDSISGVGKVTIETGKVEFDEVYCAQHVGFVPGPYNMLAVSDNGCGMDKETCEKIFEPFFTTKEVGKGTGMGLPTVYGIVKQNHGFINVYSEPGKGTTFKIYLPRHGEKGTAIDEPRTHAKLLTGTETVLLVEDNEALLKMGQAMLEELGYTVLAAGSPNEAVKLAEQYAGDIHLVLTDVVMPEMSGGDLQRRLSALWPGLKFLFMSGYTSNVIAHRGILDEGVHFLQKPFHMEELATKVRDALFATGNPHFNSDLKIENKGR